MTQTPTAFMTEYTTYLKTLAINNGGIQIHSSPLIIHEPMTEFQKKTEVLLTEYYALHVD